jgi:hypothetical protein
MTKIEFLVDRDGCVLIHFPEKKHSEEYWAWIKGLERATPSQYMPFLRVLQEQYKNLHIL